MRLGHAAEPAVGPLTALRGGQRTPVGLLDQVRLLDGPIGPGSLYAALARLERLALIDRSFDDPDRAMYRLATYEASADIEAGAARPLASSSDSTRAPGRTGTARRSQTSFANDR